jgi:hypothetical protein
MHPVILKALAAEHPGDILAGAGSAQRAPGTPRPALAGGMTAGRGALVPPPAPRP